MHYQCKVLPELGVYDLPYNIALSVLVSGNYGLSAAGALIGLKVTSDITRNTGENTVPTAFSAGMINDDHKSARLSSRQKIVVA